jgi:DNA replication protein DnaC
MKTAGSLLNNPAMPAVLVCPEHGEFRGWVTTIEGMQIQSQCEACFQEEQAAEKEKRDAEIRARMQSGQYDEARRKSCIPPKFMAKNFKDWVVTNPAAEEIKKLMADYVVNFEQYKQDGRSFLFLGNSGIGKTHLATAIANNLISRGKTAVYVSTLNFLSKVKTAWNPNSETSEDTIIEDYVSFDLLVLDELGKGNYDAKERGMLFRLIDRRYEEGKPMIGISKLSEKQLCGLIDDDAIRRLRTGGGKILHFNWQPHE